MNLRGGHDDERAKMKFGSQKAFFGRIWSRLHGSGSSVKDLRMPSPNVEKSLPEYGPGDRDAPLKGGPSNSIQMGNMSSMMGGLDVLSRQVASAASDEGLDLGQD